MTAIAPLITGFLREYMPQARGYSPHSCETYLRMDATAKLEAIEAVVPPQLRRGRFKAPDALIASLLADPSPVT